jgi:hypothetical protein
MTTEEKAEWLRKKAESRRKLRNKRQNEKNST